MLFLDLAAQAIITLYYSDPLAMINMNIMGLANMLEISRALTHKFVVVVITSDKCCENVEW